ncbi:MAG TPA: hypothetical protein VGU69_10565 [Rhizomicrobium sp.]|nr:hypothetical protein [Rhizomicrobium sp.]
MQAGFQLVGEVTDYTGSPSGYRVLVEVAHFVVDGDKVTPDEDNKELELVLPWSDERSRSPELGGITAKGFVSLHWSSGPTWDFGPIVDQITVTEFNQGS